MPLVKMTDARKGILDDLVQSEGKKSEIGTAAQSVLLASGGADSATISEKLEISMNRVRGVLRSWQDADYRLEVAERRGKRELQLLIKELFERGDDDCCCGCDESDDEFGLDREELNALAQKVFDLLNYELRVERERLGYFG